MLTIKKYISAVLAMIVLTAALPLSMLTNAATFSGKGTKSNPYLVENAAQLAAMSENLSASYKLNNTIDMKGVSFSPIGNLAKPFTGTFTCDTNSDGTPKYAIKNLTLKAKSYNSIEEQNLDFKDKNSKWECGLFGSTAGATIQNILILDGSITGGIFGKGWYNAAGDYNANKGIDQQGVGLLVGIAKNTTVSGCGVTGTADVRCVGGLFAGVIVGGSIDKCYSVGTFTSSAMYCRGLFAGSIESSAKVTNCFAEGTVNHSSPTDTPSAFAPIGKKASASNCYFSGNSNPSAAFSVGDGTETITDCTMSPKNLGIVKVTDASKYVPAVTSQASGNTSQGAQGSTTETAQTDGNTESTESAQAVSTLTAEEFSSKLTSWLEKRYSDKGWTLDEAVEILKFKNDFEKMSDEEKAKISSGDLSLYGEFYEAATLIAVSGITELIDKMPSADKITVDNYKDALKTCKKFDSLPDDVKAKFTDKRVKKVEKVYEQAKKFDGIQIIDQEVNSTSTLSEKILIIVLIAVNVILAAAAVTLSILIFRNYNRGKKATSAEFDESEDITDDV